MILCAGEALIDMLPRDTSEGAAFLPVVGGSVFNTARALGRLGAPVAMTTGLSRDLFGRQLAEALEASEVEDRAVHSDRPTTLAFVALVEGQATYAFYDENTAGRMLAPKDVAAAAARGTAPTALFFGCISLAVEPCATAYEALADAHPDLPRMIDVNVRAGVAEDEAAYRARLDRMIAAADVVKLSEDDVAFIGRDAESVLAMGPSVVCLTEGAKGATAVTAAGRIHVPAPKVAVVDTVGAGDTFNAGLLSKLHEDGALRRREAPPDDALRAALHRGVAASAVAVSRAGANPPWRREL